jgi:hypothetical protein
MEMAALAALRAQRVTPALQVTPVIRAQMVTEAQAAQQV